MQRKTHRERYIHKDTQRLRHREVERETQRQSREMERKRETQRSITN